MHVLVCDLMDRRGDADALAEGCPGWRGGRCRDRVIRPVVPGVLRGTLAPQAFPHTGGAYAMLVAWAVAAFAVTWRILARRG